MGREASHSGRGTKRRLSLRARLLAALLVVTSVFLIVLALIASLIFGKRFGQAFDEALTAATERPIVDLAGPADVYAVYYSVAAHGTGVIAEPKGGNQQVAHELASYMGQRVVDVIKNRGRLGSVKQFQPFTLALPDGGPVMRVEFRITRRIYTSQAGVPAGGRAVIIVAKPNSQREGPLGSVILAEVLTGVVLIALLGLIGPWLIRRGLAPLDEMATTADGITTKGDLTDRMPDPGDRAEMGRLSSAINTMLDRIQQAFGARLASEQKVRQFAADASHELRTPLTTIRGYAELYRQGALGPERLPDAMRRIEQEADRMSKLVAELLELARLDRMSSLDLTETDLALLVRDAVADATAVEPDRPVYAEAPPSLMAVVDEPRIRQILANLLGNVRAYTPPGTPTAVRLGQSGQSVVLEVADAGPGMSTEDAARAFDRFHRGASPGGDGQEPAAPNGRDKSGSGLGLAIVQAIARAHGGEAALDSVPGRGTRVRIWLPNKLTASPSPGR
jgi:two-component system OmpR family sensor kinase